MNISPFRTDRPQHKSVNTGLELVPINVSLPVLSIYRLLRARDEAIKIYESAESRHRVNMTPGSYLELRKAREDMEKARDDLSDQRWASNNRKLDHLQEKILELSTSQLELSKWKAAIERRDIVNRLENHDLRIDVSGDHRILVILRKIKGKNYSKSGLESNWEAHGGGTIEDNMNFIKANEAEVRKCGRFWSPKLWIRACESVPLKTFEN